MGKRDKKAEKVDAEVLQFVSTVVQDGRYVGKVAADPRRVARKLGMKLSRKARKRITNIASMDLASIIEQGRGEERIGPLIVIAVCVVIAAGPKEPRKEKVVDRSAKAKL